MKKNLTLKEMINTIQSAGIRERERVWVTFWNMQCMGFITSETWDRFYDKCKDIPMDVIDMDPFRFQAALPPL